MTLHINLPENPTVADLVAALKRCPQQGQVRDDILRDLTSIDIESDGDVRFSVLPRVAVKPTPTVQFKAPQRLLETMAGGNV
jgi:hypothetical protein